MNTGAATGAAILARATSDGDDRLIAADEPLAGLQLRCGGELPGTIAIPSLLETVRKARRYGLRLARAIAAQDGAETITAWVEVEPDEEGEGCAIVLRHWQALPLPPEDLAAAALDRAELDRELAEITALLDADQNLLTADGEGYDVAQTLSAMRAGAGRHWTQFITIEGGQHHQPMHWRLLDGSRLSLAGSSRHWRAAIIPHGRPGAEPTGFELCLRADEPAPSPRAASPQELPGNLTPLVGREIAPVLRQPIARIIANAETIRTRLAGPLTEEYSAYAADIAAAGQHLLALIDDLADLQVVEAADFVTAPDPIDLGDLARRAAGILGVRARERHITVIAPQPGETLDATGEFRRVLQILLNLVGNAIRYAPESSQVWLRLEDGNPSDPARIVVADEGPGLSAEAQGRLFGKFERLGRSGDGGSGLGLHISRRLARAMGGDLTVESAPGQGARFILDLPRGGGRSPASPGAMPGDTG